MRDVDQIFSIMRLATVLSLFKDVLIITNNNLTVSFYIWY